MDASEYKVLLQAQEEGVKGGGDQAEVIVNKGGRMVFKVPTSKGKSSKAAARPSTATPTPTSSKSHPVDLNQALSSRQTAPPTVWPVYLSILIKKKGQTSISKSITEPTIASSSKSHIEPTVASSSKFVAEPTIELAAAHEEAAVSDSESTIEHEPKKLDKGKGTAVIDLCSDQDAVLTPSKRVD